MNASREAFDLFHQPCRRNFKGIEEARRERKEAQDEADRLREALVDILAHCDEANVVYAHQPNCTCDRCIIGRIARKALEEGSDG